VSGTKAFASSGSRWLCAVALAVVTALFGLVAYTDVAGTGVKLPAPFRAGDDYGRVLARQRYQRNVSIYIGVAASDVAAGRAAVVVAPPVLDTLADRPKDKFPGPDRSAFIPDFIVRASGARIEPATYATALTAEQLASLRASHEERTYPWQVVAFVGKAPEDKVVLYTDSGRTVVYVVPFSASPLGGAR